MKEYEVSVIHRATGETIYTENSNKASDLKFYVEQAIENDCYVEVTTAKTEKQLRVAISELIKKGKV